MLTPMLSSLQVNMKDVPDTDTLPINLSTGYTSVGEYNRTLWLVQLFLLMCVYWQNLVWTVQLTTFRLSSVVSGNMCSRHSDTYIRNATVNSDVGKRNLIWILFTPDVIIEENSVDFSDVSCTELYDLSTHRNIVIVNNTCA